MAAVATLLLTACVETDGRVVATDQADAAARGDETAPQRDWVDRRVGSVGTTAKGSRITVHAVERLDRAQGGLVADIEVCVPQKDAATSFDPRIFALQVGQGVRRPVATAARQPAFTSQEVPPGECTRGWLTYRLARGERPAAVLLLASSYIRWRIGQV